MKKLYLKQRVFSFTDKFTVKDETEKDCYQIEGDMMVIGGKKLHVKTMGGKEIAMIQQKLLSLMPRFFVYVNGKQAAEIVKKISLLTAKYVIDGPGWEVKGSILDHDYTIRDHGKVIVSLHKAWLSWGDSYEISIDDGVDEVMALAVVIAIDCVQEAQQESGNADLDNDN